MWLWGGAGAIARGYDCLTFDGPGQDYALWKQQLHFRPDWEKVITPVVDFALSRPEVDAKRIAIQGISKVDSGYHAQLLLRNESPRLSSIPAWWMSPPLGPLLGRSQCWNC